VAVQVITNVPREKVGTYRQIFENAGGTVSEAPEDDGEVTLIVVFPDRGTLEASLGVG
jgi:hypothetical protein